MPRKGRLFLKWTTELLDALFPIRARIGFPLEDYELLVNLRNVFAAALDKAENRKKRNADDVFAKDLARMELETTLRTKLNTYVYYSEKVTDADRLAMGITIRKKPGTHKPVADTIAALIFDLNTPGLIKVTGFYVDKNGVTHNSKKGQHGLYLVAVVGEKPTDPEAMGNGEIATNRKHTYKYTAAQRGMAFHVACCWISATGEKGPWSQIYTLIIP
jgi:hypothetical protein